MNILGWTVGIDLRNARFGYSAWGSFKILYLGPVYACRVDIS